MKNAYPDLAAAIRGQASRILDRFRAVVREILPSADELTLAELMDHLPDALEDLATTIDAKRATSVGLMKDSRQHGSTRYHQSFNLSELLVEYSILRSLVLEEVTGALDRALTLEEVCGLNAGIDAASRRAVETFVAYQSNEMQSASESQSKYLSFLSHDLRGSLNGILLMIEVLRRELTASKQFESSLEDLDLMRRSILETVGTMDRFLHAEKFRKGKVEVKIAEVNLAALFPEVVNQFIPQAREKGVQVVVDPSACPLVSSDRELISLILQNLVSNAVKYSKMGTVTVASEMSPKGQCRLSVSDQGPGISADKLKDIFSPFTRGETHGQKGMGLGLNIALQASNLLNARLWAESQPGQGATFFLELPPSAVKK